MADCTVSCNITKSVANGDCGPYTVTIPTVDPNDKITAPTIGTVTEELVAGAGVFDVYMRAGSNQLKEQYDAGRIKGAEYAQAYIAMMQLMMTEANKFVLTAFDAEMKAKMFDYQMLGVRYDAALKEAQNKEIKYKTDLLCQQVAELKENGKVERELKVSQKQTQIQQANLYNRQIAGYNEKNKNENAKMLLDAWAVQAVEEPDASQYKITPIGTSTKLEVLANEIKQAGGFSRP
ncbi:MAG: hypothetical protein ACTSWQ_07440 [Candidatus Thorarchaeota archaeon]